MARQNTTRQKTKSRLDPDSNADGSNFLNRQQQLRPQNTQALLWQQLAMRVQEKFGLQDMNSAWGFISAFVFTSSREKNKKKEEKSNHSSVLQFLIYFLLNAPKLKRMLLLYKLSKALGLKPNATLDQIEKAIKQKKIETKVTKSESLKDTQKSAQQTKSANNALKQAKSTNNNVPGITPQQKTSPAMVVESQNIEGKTDSQSVNQHQRTSIHAASKHHSAQTQSTQSQSSEATSTSAVPRSPSMQARPSGQARPLDNNTTPSSTHSALRPKWTQSAQQLPQSSGTASTINMKNSNIGNSANMDAGSSANMSAGVKLSPG